MVVGHGVRVARAALFTVALALTGLVACGGDDDGDGDGDSGDAGDAGDAGDDDGDDAGDGACEGLECQQVDCSGGETTSLSGTVNIPSGDLPLYNAVVYVPNAEVEPFDEGVGCYRCDAQLSGDPVVETTTDTSGQFVLEDVPAGEDIPLVIQLGKWRRQIVIPTVEECVDTPLDADDTRLPRNREEGDIPRIALTTGGLDALECLLPKVGLDAEEFTPESEGGRVNFYVAEGGTPGYLAPMNGGADFTPATELWSSLENLSAYDIVLLSCEGTDDSVVDNKPDEALEAMRDYADLGGRIFASHWHHYWVEFGPTPFPSAATFADPSPNTSHQPDLNSIISDIDTSFEKGQAMAEWLMNVEGSTEFAKLPIEGAQHTVESVGAATRAIYLDDTTNGTPSVQYLSFNTPMDVEEEQQCGRYVLSDIHVSTRAGDDDEDDSAPDLRYPQGCVTDDLSPQEKALIFMLFDISSCIEPDVTVD
jgi:hypothetical protein